MILAAFSTVGIIIAIVVAIVSSLLKKKEDTFELPPELKPRGNPPPPRPGTGNWEEELRRVLGEQPAAPPVPPPLVHETARPVRRVVVTPPPVPSDMEAHIEVSLRAPEPNIEPAFPRSTTRRPHLCRNACSSTCMM